MVLGMYTKEKVYLSESDWITKFKPEREDTGYCLYSEKEIKVLLSSRTIPIECVWEYHHTSIVQGKGKAIKGIYTPEHIITGVAAPAILPTAKLVVVRSGKETYFPDYEGCY